MANKLDLSSKYQHLYLNQEWVQLTIEVSEHTSQCPINVAKSHYINATKNCIN